MKIFKLGVSGSVYTEDFTPQPLTERLTPAKKNLERLKEGASRRLSSIREPKPILWWTTPNFGKIRAEGRPKFEAELGTYQAPVPSTSEIHLPEISNPLYPKIKPQLKKCEARLDANMERWLEFSDPYYNQEKRSQETRSEEMEEEKDERSEERTRRRHVLGYTGYVPKCYLPNRSNRIRAIDPRLSVYEAWQARNNPDIENTDPEIKKNYEEMSLDRLRIKHGVTYLPIEANYSPDLNNLPFDKYK